MGAGQLGCDAEQNVEIFVIKTDTQLVDTKEQELFYTEDVSWPSYGKRLQKEEKVVKTS